MRWLTTLLATGAAGVGLVLWQWPRLPERVASHFNAAGVADGWMSRATHVMLALGLFAGMTTLFALIGWAMRRLPARWVNMPKRDYWLSGDREQRTRRELEAWCYAFGAIVNLFLLFVFQLVYLANLSDRPALDSTLMIAGLVVYLAVNLGAVVVMLIRYGRAG
jgi:uncharacterized membrane protein